MVIAIKTNMLDTFAKVNENITHDVAIAKQEMQDSIRVNLIMARERKDKLSDKTLEKNKCKEACQHMLNFLTCLNDMFHRTYYNDEGLEYWAYQNYFNFLESEATQIDNFLHTDNNIDYKKQLRKTLYQSLEECLKKIRAVRIDICSMLENISKYTFSSEELSEIITSTLDKYIDSFEGPFIKNDMDNEAINAMIYSMISCLIDTYYSKAKAHIVIDMDKFNPDASSANIHVWI